VKQRLSLEEQHLAAWLAQWNTPHDLFRPGDMVGGFPNGVFLNKLPKDVDGLGAQLAKLPIAELHLYGLKIRDLEMVFPMPTFRHVTTLSISGTPSTKLERKLVTRLAEIVPPRLEDLAMRGVIAPGTDLRARARAYSRSYACLSGRTWAAAAPSSRSSWRSSCSSRVCSSWP